MGPLSPKQDWAHLGRVIRRWRLERGIRRQSDLATAITEAVGQISFKTIQNYEQGREPQTAPGIPDGYTLVAKFFEWPPGAIEHVLAGGEPEELDRPSPTPSQLTELAAPVFTLVDDARDAGAPEEMVRRTRDQLLELLGWLLEHTRRPGYGLAASRPHAEGEGPAADDAERIERALRERRP